MNTLGLIDQAVEIYGLLDRPIRIVRQARGYFDRDKAVQTFGAVVHRPKNVGGIGYILNNEDFVYVGGRFTLFHQFFYSGIVVGRSRNSLLEDSGIGRNPHDPAIDEGFQSAVRDQAPANIIEPGALSQLCQLLKCRFCHKFAP